MAASRETVRYWGEAEADRQAAFKADESVRAQAGWLPVSQVTEWPIGRTGLDLVVTYERSGPIQTPASGPVWVASEQPVAGVEPSSSPRPPLRPSAKPTSQPAGEPSGAPLLGLGQALLDRAYEGINDWFESQERAAAAEAERSAAVEQARQRSAAARAEPSSRPATRNRWSIGAGDKTHEIRVYRSSLPEAPLMQVEVGGRVRAEFSIPTPRLPQTGVAFTFDGVVYAVVAEWRWDTRWCVWIDAFRGPWVLDLSELPMMTGPDGQERIRWQDLDAISLTDGSTLADRVVLAPPRGSVTDALKGLVLDPDSMGPYRDWP
jgi:hypothetical protein